MNVCSRQGLKSVFAELWVHKLTAVQDGTLDVHGPLFFLSVGFGNVQKNVGEEPHYNNMSLFGTVLLPLPLSLVQVLLILFQELWQHGKKFNWKLQSLWGHLFRISDTLGSTKECLEDILGKLGDYKRENKNPFKCLSLERGHTLSLHHLQWGGEEWPTVRVTPSDLMDKSCTAKYKGRGKFVAATSPSSTVLQSLRADGSKSQGIGVEW